MEIIRKQAFRGCKSLKNIKIPSELTEIKEQAFYNSGIEKIDLSNSLKIIHIFDLAFQDCSNLETVIFPTVFPAVDNYEANFWRIFSGCTSLNTFAVMENDNDVVVEDNVIYYGDVLLAGVPNNSNKNIVVREGTTKIYKFAFLESNIETIVLPDSCNEIGRNAFQYCYSLKKVDLGNGKIDLRLEPFDYCSKEIVILHNGAKCDFNKPSDLTSMTLE